MKKRRRKLTRQASRSLEPTYQAAFEFLEKERSIRLTEYRIVGNYYRFDNKIISNLRSIVRSIKEIFEMEKWCVHNNYLIWSKPGVGKSHFAEELGKELSNKSVKEFRIDLREIKTEAQLRLEMEKCKQIIDGNNKVFACIDEVDLQISGQTSYEILYGPADWNNKGLPIVWLYLASTTQSLNELMWNITTKFKGPDFISRVPHRLDIPPLSPGDKIIIAAAIASNNGFTGVKRSALMTIAMRKEIQGARDILQCIKFAREKLKTNELSCVDLFISELVGIDFYNQFKDILKELNYDIDIKH